MKNNQKQNGMNVTKELLNTKKNKNNNWKRKNLSAMMNSLRKIKQVKKRKKKCSHTNKCHR